jgi:transcriptional regulator with XRE-family HTH domain
MLIKRIGAFLKDLRKDQKKTLNDIAIATGTSKSYISQIENGIRNPSDAVLENVLQKAFGTDKGEAQRIIRSWRIDQYKEENGNNVEVDKGTSVNTSLKSEGNERVPADQDSKIPFYDNITQNFKHTQPDDYVPFPIGDPAMTKRLFMWQIKDDSMNSLIPEKAFLIVDRDIMDLGYKSIVLTLVNGKPAVRYYERHEDKVKLIPANKNYPVFFGEKLQILGIVRQMLVEV